MNRLEVVKAPIEALKNSTIIGKSFKFLEAMDTAQKIAPSCANVFISGESGTGKEVFAKFIHSRSKRAHGPFVAINCSAIPENLLESELFGHARGSFTGAIDKKIGLFEEAQDGTLFLDEIGDLSVHLQAKLLRVLQEKSIKRIGENQTRTINARIISATHRNLAKEVAVGKFREDLFYRLSVIPLEIPPLRERKEDILPLAEFFLSRFAAENNSPAKLFSLDARDHLLSNHWRGNVRELENAIERAVVLATELEVKAKDFSTSLMDQDISQPKPAISLHQGNFVIQFEDHLPTVHDVLQKYVEFAVQYNRGAKDRTAKDIGIDRKTLYKKLRSDLTGISP